MANPFGKDGGPVQSVGRNTFDLSFQNNLTTQFGRLTPVFCKEVLPGDSFKIDTTFGLRFMPTAFPLQTRMRADIHFFYVRNRNLWKNWPDFYGRTKENLVFPYLKGDGQSVDLSTGSLADMLGVPTTLVGDYGNSTTPKPIWSGVLRRSVDGSAGSNFLFDVGSSDYSFEPPSWSLFHSLSNAGAVGGFDRLNDGHSAVFWRVYSLPSAPDTLKFKFSVGSRKSVALAFGCVNSSASVPFGVPVDVYLTQLDAAGIIPTLTYTLGIEDMGNPLRVTADVNPTGNDVEVVFDDFQGSPSTWSRYFVAVGVCFDVQNAKLSDSLSSDSLVDNSDYEYVSTVRDFISTSGAVNPFDVTNPNHQKLSALPFRAYESIYNSFYRDERNNPYILNGEKEYNIYLPTTEGGEDNTPYDYHYRNWEQDAYTTAVNTPQQGQAPLVGISAMGVMTFADPESGEKYSVQAETADDADTVVGFNMTEDLPNSVKRSLVSYASSGISINDFRNVNAFQRWLETNIRRGFKYRDMIKSHFDVDVSFQELDMPEFIGGVSCDVTPNTVTQTSADSEQNPLGSYAGQLYGSGSSKHSVQNYCDEHGFIIGIMSVVPVPNYSQLLPKFFTKVDDSFDYFSPEFGHIGMQPIPYSEVCPVQVVNAGDKLTDTFGYQRAFYDYMQSFDEVHGQFRTTLKNFVMNRVFDNKPTLSPDFTVINPEHLNDVFTVQSVNGEVVDKILGQLYFDVKVKRPIPRYGIPRLE